MKRFTGKYIRQGVYIGIGIMLAITLVIGGVYGTYMSMTHDVTITKTHEVNQHVTSLLSLDEISIEEDDDTDY